MNTPYGPHKITGNRQVAIPKQLADKLHLITGDQVYFMHNDEAPGTLLLIPMELLSQWIDTGRAQNSPF